MQTAPSAGALYDGLTSLHDGCDTLTDGVAQLKDGAKKLNVGMHDFKSEGTDQIMELYNDQVKTLIERFRAVGDSARAYKNFSGLSNDMDGSVKFIYTIDGTKE